MTRYAELREAIATGDEALARSLVLDEPALARAAGSQGETALHLAAARGAVAIVELLLAQGADPCAFDADDQTPGDHAAQAGCRELAQRLRLAGAVTR